MWGTYWEWDPRLTSELILLFLYLGYMALRSAIDDVQRADRASALLAVVGVVNVPIIHYSVLWWNSLHQAPSVMKLAKPEMPAAMLLPLLMMLAGFTFFFVALLLVEATSPAVWPDTDPARGLVPGRPASPDGGSLVLARASLADSR